MKKIIHILIAFCAYQISFAQTMEISGTISERIDIFNKKNKIKKNQFELIELGEVSITVFTDKSTIKNVTSDKSGFFNIKFPLTNNTTYYIKYFKNGYYPKISKINITTFPPDEYLNTTDWDLALRKKLKNVSSSITNKPFEIYTYNSESAELIYDLDYSLDYQYEFEDALISSIEEKVEENKEIETANNLTAEKAIKDANIEAKRIISEAKNKAVNIIENTKLTTTSIIATTRKKADNTIDSYINSKKSNFDKAYNKELNDYIKIEKAKIEASLKDSISKSYDNDDSFDENSNHQIFTDNDEVNIKRANLLNAKQQLEIDKLKAQTLEDKILIKLREDEIYDAEQEVLLADAEIKHAENELLLQKSEVKNQKNIIIIGTLIILIILIALWLIYKNFKDKKETSIVLTKQNKIIEAKNKDILSSIKYAKRIQEAILPHPTFWENKMPNSFVLYMPKDIVSGDFYWLENIEDKVLFAAVDCTGHGVPGGFMSIVGYHSLQRAVNEFKLTKPSEILDNLQESVNTILRQGFGINAVKDGMDVALCSLNTKTLQLEYSGAYNPLWILRDNKIIETKATKQAVGSFMQNIVPFENHAIQLEKGDIIYIFSDGFADQFGGMNGKKIMQKGVKRILIENSTLDLDNQRKELKKYIYNWMNEGNEDQVDDICIIGMKV